jgi:hypothetical protein
MLLTLPCLLMMPSFHDIIATFIFADIIDYSHDAISILRCRFFSEIFRFITLIYAIDIIDISVDYDYAYADIILRHFRHD